MSKKEILVRTKNLKKDYVSGKVITKALKGINIEIYKGEFLGIMGPSGSGKSTLLHLLGLLDVPTEGEIYFLNERVDSLPERKKTLLRLKHIGYVFQQYRLIPELRAYENVMLPYLMLTGNFNEAKRISKNMINKVGIGRRWNRYPFELSGGEQQRIAIARALVNDPIVIYADEPTANLDTHAGEQIMNLFKELNKKHNHTVVVVSHEEEHKRYFDRIIYIRDGRVEKIEKKKN